MDALMLLDNGNRMVDKCTAFLGRLNPVLSSLSELLEMGSCPLKVLKFRQTIGSPSSALCKRTFVGDRSAVADIQDNIAPIPGRTSIPYYQSPPDMDLGEFMIENDVNFMNWSYFDSNHSPVSPPAREHD